jgi:hypothetical protein
VDCYSPGQGLMPASFKVQTVLIDGGNGGTETEEVLIPDFGEAAIGRVAPVDSGRFCVFCCFQCITIVRSFMEFQENAPSFNHLLLWRI